MSKIPIIAVVGPTASGKTELAVSLAKRLDAEVISFDSMQIYKGMHIASAAPDIEEMQGVTHHLIEFLEPDTSFSVADFVKLAHKTAADIAARGKRVIIAGGTGFYINSFLDNIIFGEEDTDSELRRRLNDEYDTIGGEAMLEKLRGFDPASAHRLHPNNKKRVIRAFEVYYSTGSTITRQQELSRGEETPYIPYMVGVTYKERELLYGRINRRVDLMLKKGLLEEARAVFNAPKGTTAIQAIGHKEFFPYFKGECDLETAVELLKGETRRYAKRQLTWFRRDERINWIYRDETDDITARAVALLERNGYFG